METTPAQKRMTTLTRWASSKILGLEKVLGFDGDSIIVQVSDYEGTRSWKQKQMLPCPRETAGSWLDTLAAQYELRDRIDAERNALRDAEMAAEAAKAQAEAEAAAQAQAESEEASAMLTAMRSANETLQKLWGQSQGMKKRMAKIFAMPCGIAEITSSVTDIAGKHAAWGAQDVTYRTTSYRFTDKAAAQAQLAASQAENARRDAVFARQRKNQKQRAARESAAWRARIEAERQSSIAQRAKVATPVAAAAKPEPFGSSLAAFFA